MSPEEAKALSINRSRSGLTVTFSPIAIAGSLAVLCAGFILVFALGVMLGRGHSLESKIPELEALMPGSSHSVTPVVIEGGGDGAGHVVTVFEGSASGEPVRAEVIGPAELEYRENLKKTTPSRRDTQEKETKNAKPLAKKTEKSAPAAESKSAAEAKKASPKTAQTASASETQSSGTDTKKYQFVYQVASSRDQAASESFASRLKGAGLDVRTEKNDSGEQTWYRTIVNFAGTTAEAEAFRERMKTLGIQNALLKSKK
ncbi:SPOR domain-containing protein [Desulfovibrio sp. OttesenSCG-928-G15]|nr:SPOR domain-containing protein [Desulfovibrio sp. OttesenSCG-928-G15]